MTNLKGHRDTTFFRSVIKCLHCQREVSRVIAYIEQHFLFLKLDNIK